MLRAVLQGLPAQYANYDTKLIKGNINYNSEGK